MTGAMHLIPCVLRIWKCPNNVQNGCIKSNVKYLTTLHVVNTNAMLID
nr:MAG TPA: hypothetical protein [Caudoviricetes sp.]